MVSRRGVSPCHPRRPARNRRRRWAPAVTRGRVRGTSSSARKGRVAPDRDTPPASCVKNVNKKAPNPRALPASVRKAASVVPTHKRVRAGIAAGRDHRPTPRAPGVVNNRSFSILDCPQEKATKKRLGAPLPINPPTSTTLHRKPALGRLSRGEALLPCAGCGRLNAMCMECKRRRAHPSRFENPRHSTAAGRAAAAAGVVGRSGGDGRGSVCPRAPPSPTSDRRRLTTATRREECRGNGKKGVPPGHVEPIPLCPACEIGPPLLHRNNRFDSIKREGCSGLDGSIAAIV